MNKTVQLAGIIHESLTNGPGMRRVLFAQGCRHNCKGCFNSHTHNFNGGQTFNIDNIVTDIKKNPLIKGVTFSGGDPIEQAEAFSLIAKEVRKLNKNVWCYTGYTFEEILKNSEKDSALKELIKNIDVLVDGKFDISKKDDGLKYRGSSNQRIIDVKRSLSKGEAVIVEGY
ncbi:MAG: anaerobic ribonucleoside-triphosphate reductase activating protein [Clostridium argentinense]|uniref:Anaerobic ribonucleoside-triphosphate reductase-activating protein n=1 Tax=Clostridium faecium TaxID=2762223 RepID=A0ABR8YVI0_9CLOT|nr:MULTISPECIES: anaerobic ribonucleoside-triphosphate reductase activating protein [Clostridium]MBD8048184.1 anaerobic ribonucleoside-triphosphate reductase activating protein [Clostridium faecium]MBS5823607.1 anaerobic ribonucleoside-triphosphate reductase activating protein [Clostridium argentinense]MDU1348638.1 anaerobic ribonucleoside-triphosphate reductase activating protein [Clostridium argentinense]